MLQGQDGTSVFWKQLIKQSFCHMPNPYSEVAPFVGFSEGYVHLASDANSSGSHNHLALWLEFTRCANVSFLLSHRASDWKLDFQILGCSWHCCIPHLIPNEMLSSRKSPGAMADAGLKSWPCLCLKKSVSPGISWCENSNHEILWSRQLILPQNNWKISLTLVKPNLMFFFQRFSFSCLCLCVYVYTHECRYPQRPEAGMRSFGVSHRWLWAANVGWVLGTKLRFSWSSSHSSLS